MSAAVVPISSLISHLATSIALAAFAVSAVILALFSLLALVLAFAVPVFVSIVAVYLTTFSLAAQAPLENNDL